MSTEPVNIHATAIVTGTTGLLFIGPSGSGKSELAFSCLAAARRYGIFASLVSDDRVLISCHRNHVIARRPASIAGLMELRGSGIASMESLEAAVMHVAIRPIRLSQEERLPPESEVFPIPGGLSLPLIRIPSRTAEPLAVIDAFYPFLP